MELVSYWSNLQFVMALLPPARPTRRELSVVDFFLDRIAVASPRWENGFYLNLLLKLRGAVPSLPHTTSLRGF
jgi:hypothetical protein